MKKMSPWSRMAFELHKILDSLSAEERQLLRCACAKEGWHRAPPPVDRSDPVFLAARLKNRVFVSIASGGKSAALRVSLEAMAMGIQCDLQCIPSATLARIIHLLHEDAPEGVEPLRVLMEQALREAITEFPIVRRPAPRPVHTSPR